MSSGMIAWDAMKPGIVSLVLAGSITVLPGAPWMTRLEGAPPDRSASEFFESRVRPLLITHCQKCHGATKQEGGLRLDAREAVMTGGDSGPAIIPGKPDESLVIQAVSHSEELRMPPKGKLSEAEISVLRRWVADGASWPQSPRTVTTLEKASGEGTESSVTAFSAEEGAFWAFQSLSDAPVPSVKRRDWVQSPIDASSWPSSNERAPARSASRPTDADPPRHVRPDRAAADARGGRGVPANDHRPGAFAKVVDRLLASPRYGERWGRHWLDLARYADSNGMDENVAYANAFRYRDYVIRSFNADKPYDQFVKEQIAGDLLPPGADRTADRDRLIATGFLVIGPKMLAEDDPVKMEMDIIDEQVDTVGRVFMGLTLGCARCHDHKFDPIPTADYYALAGIFKSTKIDGEPQGRRACGTSDSLATGRAERGSRPTRRVAAARPRSTKVIKQATTPCQAIRKTARGQARSELAKATETHYRAADQIGSMARGACEKPRPGRPIPGRMGVEDQKAIDLRDPHPRQSSDARRGSAATVSRRSWPATARPAARLVPERPARAGRVADPARSSPDRPGDGQPDLARALRRGLVRSPDNFGRLGDRPDSSRAARLAGPPVRRVGLVGQGDASADHALVHLPDEHQARRQRPRWPTRRTACSGG